MPTPLRGNHTFMVSIDALLNNPGLGSMIAAIACAWEMIEDELGILLATIVQGDRKSVMQMYYAIGSSKARIDAIQRVAQQALPEELYKRFVGSLKDELKKRASERAAVIHTKWGTVEKYPDSLISVGPFGRGRGNEMVAYNGKDFGEIIDRMIRLHRALAAFRVEVESLHRPAR